MQIYFYSVTAKAFWFNNIQCAHAEATAMTIISTCPKCGIIKRSGKMSCCGHGGSWFGNCGSVDDTKFDHTWHEGLQACKVRAHSKTIVGHQITSGQKRSNDSFDADGDVNSEAVMMGSREFAFISAAIPGERSRNAPANTSTTNTTLLIPSKPITTALTTMKSTSVNILNLSITVVDTSASPWVRIPMSQSNGLMTASVRRQFVSRGYKGLVNIIARVGFVLTIVFL